MSKTIYVSNKFGNNKNSGSVENPFETLEFAFSKLEAGDTCVIREGVYREQIKTVLTGTEQNQITIKAFENEMVVISGTKKIEQFSEYKTNILKTNIGLKTKQVFIDGKYVNSARFPNGGTFMKPKLYKFNVVGENVVDIGDGSKPKDFWKDSIVWGVFNRGWVAQNGIVESSDSYYANIKPNPSFWEKGIGRGYITNNINLLSNNGDWYCDENDLYIYSDKPLANVEYKAIDVAFDFSGSSFINFNDLNFFSSRIVLDDCNNCCIDSCDFKYVNEIDFFKGGFVQETPDLNVDSTGVGVYLGGNNNIIKNCLVRYSAGSGITVTGNENQVTNCIIKEVDYSGIDCGGIQVTGSGHIISHNTISDTGRFGISHRYLKKGKIVFNKIFDFGYLTDDLGATYCFLTDGEGTEIAYNMFYDGKASRVSVGVYIDNDSANHHVHNNIIWSVSDAVRVNLTNENAEINNNLFLDVEAAMGFWGPDDSKMVNINVYDNVSDDNLLMGNKIENNKILPKTENLNIEQVQKLALEYKIFESQTQIDSVGANING